VSERIHVDWQPPVKLEFSPLYSYENAGGGGARGGADGGAGGDGGDGGAEGGDGGG
jgi:hypothetical protein